jgi:hypothetical protein
MQMLAMCASSSGAPAMQQICRRSHDTFFGGKELYVFSSPAVVVRAQYLNRAQYFNLDLHGRRLSLDFIKALHFHRASTVL